MDPDSLNMEKQDITMPVANNCKLNGSALWCIDVHLRLYLRGCSSGVDVHHQLGSASPGRQAQQRCMLRQVCMAPGGGQHGREVRQQHAEARNPAPCAHGAATTGMGVRQGLRGPAGLAGTPSKAASRDQRMPVREEPRVAAGLHEGAKPRTDAAGASASGSDAAPCCPGQTPPSTSSRCAHLSTR